MNVKQLIEQLSKINDKSKVVQITSLDDDFTIDDFELSTDYDDNNYIELIINKYIY